MIPIIESDIEKVQTLDINDIEIVTDTDYDDKIEIYMLDDNGNRVEGGTFDRNSFMDHILQFYNDNF